MISEFRSDDITAAGSLDPHQCDRPLPLLFPLEPIRRRGGLASSGEANVQPLTGTSLHLFLSGEEGPGLHFRVGFR